MGNDAGTSSPCRSRRTHRRDDEPPAARDACAPAGGAEAAERAWPLHRGAGVAEVPGCSGARGIASCGGGCGRATPSEFRRRPGLPSPRRPPLGLTRAGLRKSARKGRTGAGPLIVSSEGPSVNWRTARGSPDRARGRSGHGSWEQLEPNGGIETHMKLVLEHSLLTECLAPPLL